MFNTKRNRRIAFVIALASSSSIGCRVATPLQTTPAFPRKQSLATEFPTKSLQTRVDSQAAESSSAVLETSPVTTASYSPTVIAIAPEFDTSSSVDESKSSSSSLDASASTASNEQLQSIDLATALLLTTGQNPKIQFARARVEESTAQLQRANSLKLPSIRAGVNYNKHLGSIQDVVGDVIETNRSSYYQGFGANAVGASSPAVPGLVSQFHVADAIFLPRIAQRTNCARQSESQGTINDSLLATSLAYIDLVRAQQELSIAKDILELAKALEQATAEFMRAGSGLASDHDRARTELALRENEILRAEEYTLVSSATLAQQIRWDSSQQLIPSESQLVPITLVSNDLPRQDLVAMALQNRPELSEAKHLVGAAVERLKRERNAPLVPSIILGASYGGMGGGREYVPNNYGDRFDFDAGAYWEVRQLGVGERAIRREAQSRITQARAMEMQQMDRIAREVVEAYVQSELRFRQIAISERAIEAANDSYERNLDRIKNGQGLPIEVLQAIQALGTARREYFRTVAEYNIAQFSLHRSLGWPVVAVP
jgi:outer membrane protein TolC